VKSAQPAADAAFPWTIDNSLSCHFRHTTIVMRNQRIFILFIILLSDLASAFAPPQHVPFRTHRTSCSTGMRHGRLLESQQQRNTPFLRPSLCKTAASSTSLLALLEATQSLLAVNAGELEVTNVIKQAFSVATFLPQPFWLLLILLPNAKITKQIMGDYKVVALFCLVHLCIVLSSISEPNGTAPMVEFADVFDPEGNPQGAMVHMMTYPNFVSEEWSHVLTWDLLVGRWIWLDGLRRGIFTAHSVLLANLIGPPGLLLHFATCLMTGKGIGGNEALDASNQEESQ